MIDRDRTFHRLMAATRQRKAEDRHAREALAQDNFYPRYKTRQIVTGRNKHPARWMLWRPNRRAQIPSALRSAKPIRWRIR
jgi:hypothetical protein